MQKSAPQAEPETRGSAARPVLSGAGITALARRLATSHPALFLDYDGTLTEIQPRPELAQLDETMRDRLVRLVAAVPIAVVSGRDLDDVRGLVGVPGLVYVGSHGFDMDLPGGRRTVGDAFLPALDEAQRAVRLQAAQWPGCRVERKRYAVTLHTRGATADVKERATAGMAGLAAAMPDLRLTGGKEVLELRPDCDWDKGRAVAAILDLPAYRRRTAVYVGDDLTDEDAFRAVLPHGTAILVGDHGGPTAAVARIADVPAVAQFLDDLLAVLDG